MAVNYYSPYKGMQEGVNDAQQSAFNKNRNRLLAAQVQGAEQNVAQGAATAARGNQERELTQALAEAQHVAQNPAALAEMPPAMQQRAREQLGERVADPQAVSQWAGSMIAGIAARLGQGPAPKPTQMETIQGPDGALLQRDPVTGALKEVLGRRPRDPAPEKGPAAPAGYRFKADGSLEAIPGGPAAGGPKNGNISEGERKAAALGTRLEGSLRELSTIPMNEQKPGVMETVAGVAGETAANLARSSDRQRADAAQLDALDAALTLATGAAYTKEQLANLRKSYFPQLGDSEANRAAKQKRFEMIVETARIAAGRAEPAINQAQNGASGSWTPGASKQVGSFKVTRKK